MKNLKWRQCLRIAWPAWVMLCICIPTQVGIAETPTIEQLIEASKRREALFDGCDVSFRSNIVNPGETKPLFKQTCRWIQSGGRLHVNWETVADIDGREDADSYKLAYDGDVARVFREQHRDGRILRDVNQELSRTGYIGPDSMCVIVPESGRKQVSEFIREGSFTSPGSMQKINRNVRIVGEDVVEGNPAVTVDVILSPAAASDRREVYRLFLLRRYDWALGRVDHLIVKNGNEEKVITKMYMTDFKKYKEGLWLPQKARYEIYQQTETVKQTWWFSVEAISWPEKFDDKLFRMEFPAGTSIVDNILGISYRSGEMESDARVFEQPAKEGGGGEPMSDFGSERKSDAGKDKGDPDAHTLSQEQSQITASQMVQPLAKSGEGDFSGRRALWFGLILVCVLISGIAVLVRRAKRMNSKSGST